MPPSDPKTAGDQSRQARVKRLGNLIIVLSTLGVVVLGILATLDVWHGPPVAAPFTRVGGETNVETAVDASRFWLTSPQVVVETSATAPSSIMLGAAQCAMVHGAPLLFTSPNRKRQQLVGVAIAGFNHPPVITIQSPGDVTDCLEMTTDRVDVNGLSTLAGPYSLVQFPKNPPKIPDQQTLAPTVVFAAALEPGFLPDVAVGMALAAHMATAHNPVSLVVVPRYLEADPKLENQLERQHKLVSGGVVLGQTVTIPEDTRALLRQLLTSRDQLGLIAQVQGDLAGVEPFITALLALLAAGVLVREEPEIEPYVVGAWHQVAKVGPPVARAWHQVANVGPPVARAWHQVAVRPINKLREKLRGKPMTNGQPIPAIADLRIALRDPQQVTIWLRNGWTVTGTTAEQGSGDGESKHPTVTVLRLENVTLEKAAAQIGTANSVLVPIGEIDLIATGFSNPAPRGTPTVSVAAPAGDGTTKI